MSRLPARSESIGDADDGRGFVRRLSRLTWCACGVFLLLGGCALWGLRLNLSGSMPVGLYLIVREPPVRGSIVLACLPIDVSQLAMARGYVPHGGSCPGGAMPIGKPILAVPGDTVVVTKHGVILNGDAIPNSRPLFADRLSRRLPTLSMDRHIVRPSEYWIVSDFSPYSFDSRYFGSIHAGDIRSQVRALLTIDP